jgi:phosphoglycolate phosphatase-like HAD superfamily hydrolase
VTNPRVVILDIDGTLLVSNDAHTPAVVEAGKSLGLFADFPSIRRLIGKGGDKLIPEAFGFDDESEPGKKLQKAKDRMFRPKSSNVGKFHCSSFSTRKIAHAASF